MSGASNGAIIIPAAGLPISGMKMRVSSKNGLLTIEFERDVGYLQFNQYDARRFVQGLIDHINSMASQEN